MIPWTPDLEIGEPGVDHQHREIFRRAGILAGALTQGQGREEVGRLVEYVAAYTYGHFQDEEFLMEELGYPHLAAHRQLHGAFLAEMQERRSAFQREGASSALAISFHLRVCGWLREHIAASDRELARWRRAAGR
jgi:hemerythrin